MKHFNELTPAELERLALLNEELCEAGQIIGKIIRHGYESTHPDGGPTNRKLLEKELGDVTYAMKLMVSKDDISIAEINHRIRIKAKTVRQYFHHQEEQP